MKKARPYIISPPMVAAALFGLLAVAGLGVNLQLVHERREMRTELAVARGEMPPPGTNESVQTSAEIARLNREFAEEEALLVAAEKKAATISTRVPPIIENEQLHSFGGIEQMGQEAAVFLPQLARFMEQLKNKDTSKLPPEESERMMNAMMGWMNRLEAVGELEANPAEIAKFHAATLQTRLGLDGETRSRVEQQLKEEFTQLNTQELTRPHRPDEKQDDWYNLRNKALNQASARIESLIPPTQRKQFIVGQSLYLGAGLRSQTTVGPDGHGSVVVGLALPGLGLE
jgi:hypothetical protein